MGYTTDFYGEVEVYPPLNAKEIEYLKKFANSRRMDRKNGPYFVEGSGFHGQGSDNDIHDYNRPPEGQPGLWCKWEPTEDGSKIQWNGAEKFYDPVEWMQYLINHFIGENPLAKEDLPFFNRHVVHGIIEAQGEEHDDHWFLVVENNKVRAVEAKHNAPEINPLNTQLVTQVSSSVKPQEKNENVEEKAKDIYKQKKSRFNL